MSEPKLSVIIPVYNSRETLGECITAVLNSDYKDYELIVIDDASTDDSVEVAKKFPCRVISLETNQGAAVTRNRGAREAKNEILLFIDSDIIVKPDSISKIITKFSEDDNISGVVGAYCLDNRFTNFLSQYKHMIACYRDKITSCRGDETCEDLSHDSFRGAFFALKKEIFAKHKFDGQYKRASIEDIEFGRKLLSLGYKFVVDKDNQVEHLKKITVKSFFKNQCYRSNDLIKTYLNKKAYKYYLSKERKNQYDKRYFMRVPVSWLTAGFLILFLITRNYMFGAGICFLFLSSIFLEKDFLGFALAQKGLFFAVKCVMIYFFDGFVCGLGILKGLAENYSKRKV